jgi:hypothetical protein
MDILAEVLDRVRLGGTLLFHFELGHASPEAGGGR